LEPEDVAEKKEEKRGDIAKVCDVNCGTGDIL
jgi:hypothetical protein